MGWSCAIITLIILPALNYMVIKKASPEKFADEIYTKKYGEFWRMFKQKTAPLLYYAVFMIRRIILVVVSF